MTTSPSPATPSTARAESKANEAVDNTIESLRHTQASAQEAVGHAERGIAQLIPATIPTLFAQPVKLIDFGYQLIEKSISMQRQMLHGLVSSAEGAAHDTAKEFKAAGDEQISAGRVEHRVAAHA